jgi:CheY-like chemotaxis protein
MAKILLVEDDNNLREIYEARLQAEGYDIVSAMNGEEALVVAKQERPDLIISDVMMPRISGFEMLDILRNTEGLRDVRIIMLTALGQAEDKTRADALGADRYLVKSQVTLEDIVKAVQELLSPPEPAAPAELPALSATPAVAVTPAPSITPVAEPVAVATDTPAAAPTPPVPAPVVEPPTAAIPVVAPPQPEAMPAVTVSEPPAVAPVTATPTAAPATDTGFGGSTAYQTAAAPDASTAVTQPPAAVPELVSDLPQPTMPTAPADPVAPAPSDAPDNAAAESQVEASEPQSTSAEEAAVRAQIEDFVQHNTPVTDPIPVAPNVSPASVATPVANVPQSVAPTAPTQADATPQTETPVVPVAPSPVAATPQAPSIDAPAQPAPSAPVPSQPPHVVMEDALKDLMANTKLPNATEAPQPVVVTPPAPQLQSEPTTPPAVAPAPEVVPQPAPAAPATVPNADGSVVAHKKIISPITPQSANSPDELAQLLAKEGITSIEDDEHNGPLPATPAASPQLVAPAASGQLAAPSPQVASPVATPPVAVQPQSNDSAVVPHPPGHVISPNGDTTDPNRIAL